MNLPTSIMKLILILLLCCVIYTDGYVRKFSMRSNGEIFELFDSFGFLEGGKLEINSIDVKFRDYPKSLWLLGCSKKDLNSKFGSFDNEECEQITNQTCEISYKFNGSISNLDFEIKNQDMVYFVLANCQGIGESSYDYTVKFDYVLLNPKGEQLSTVDIPFPSLFIVLLACWFVMTSVWCFNWIQNRHQKIKLHRVISLFPIFKLAYCAASVYYWKILSKVGIETTGTVVIYGIFHISFEVVFYCVLLIIASGWGINKDELGRDRYYITAVAFGLTLALVASFVLQGYFTLLIMIIYIIIIVAVFKNANRNINDLFSESSSSVSPSVGDPENIHVRSRNTNQEKYQMFRAFKIIMLTYLCAITVIVLLTVVFLSFYPWIYQMLTELLHLMMFVCIGWTFRLRNVNLYYRISDDEYDFSYNQNENDSTTMSEISTSEASVGIGGRRSRNNNNSRVINVIELSTRETPTNPTPTATTTTTTTTDENKDVAGGTSSN